MKTCSIEGRPKPSRKRTWCSAHYSRWRKNGDPVVCKPRGWNAFSPETQAHVLACVKAHKHSPESRQKISTANKGREGKRAAANGRWVAENVTYHGLHKRLRAQREMPQVCAVCGDTEGRFEWAWNHTITNHTRYDPVGRGYSLNLNDYIGLCCSCHRRYDVKVNRLTLVKGVA